MAPPTVIRAGPFGSVVDPSDPGTAKPTRLLDAVNCYVPDPVLGSPVVQRHGLLALPEQLGSGDVRRGQGLHEHRRVDGTLDRFTFGGGRMYVWDGDVTYVDVTPSTIAIDPANPVFAKTIDDRVVISDETNKPWVYDPKDGTGVVIEYNSIGEEWNTKGGPAIRSGRVVFIVKQVGLAVLTTEDGDVLTTEDDEPLITEALQGFQNTIAWSAPLDPLLGYDQDDYDNTWTLTQSSAELLTCLVADEAALTYFRRGGISYITGDIEDDFRTSASVDSISGATFGTNTPAATIMVDPGGGRKIWFLDLDGRVHRMAPTGQPENLWQPMRRVVDAHIGAADCQENVSRYARAAYHPSLRLVLFTIWDEQTLYVFDAKSGLYLGTWSISDGDVHITAMGSLVDAANRVVFLAIGTSGYVGDGPAFEHAAPSTHGTIWRQKFSDDPAPWYDTFIDAVSAQPVPFERAIETHWLAHAGSLVFRLLGVVASVIGSAVTHTFGLAYTVPASGRRTEPLVARSSRVQGGIPGERALATVNWGLGRNAQGGAIRLRITAENEQDVDPFALNVVQFGVHAIEGEVQTTKARRNAI